MNRSDLDAAAAEGIITASQARALSEFLASRRPTADPATATFSITHVLYYLGGMIAIGALSLFMTLAWERIGAAALLATALAYCAAALALAAWFERRTLAIPAGIMATLAIVTVPLAVYAVQHLLGLWPESKPGASYRDYHYLIDWRWIVMELATLAAGAVVLRHFRYPFLLMPIAVTLWYLSMDLAPFLTGESQWSESLSRTRKWISIAMGATVIAFAFLIDLRSRFTRDYAFWLYLFGLATFWGGLSLLGSGLLSGKLIYLAINIVLVLTGAVIGRRAFAVFGGIGIAIVLGDISHTYFKDSFAFTIALTFIGLGIVGAGVLWQRAEAAIAVRLREFLPPALRELLEARRG